MKKTLKAWGTAPHIVTKYDIQKLMKTRDKKILDCYALIVMLKLLNIDLKTNLKRKPIPIGIKRIPIGLKN